MNTRQVSIHDRAWEKTCRQIKQYRPRSQSLNACNQSKDQHKRDTCSHQSSHIAAFALAASSSLRLCAAFSSSLRLRSFSRTALS